MATRAQVETVLVRRVGRLMTAAGLDGVTRGGENVDLADPIGYALRACGYAVADISNPTSAEVAAVSDADIDKFVDMAELRTYENILGNLDSVDYTLGPQSESLGQLSAKVEKRIEWQKAKLVSEYGVGAATLSDSTKLEVGWEAGLDDATEYA